MEEIPARKPPRVVRTKTHEIIIPDDGEMIILRPRAQKELKRTDTPATGDHPNDNKK